MAQYRSATEYNYHNSEQGKTVGTDAVEMEKDGWVQAQLDAGLIVEVVEEKAAAKAKKEAAAE